MNFIDEWGRIWNTLVAAYLYNHVIDWSQRLFDGFLTKDAKQA